MFRSIAVFLDAKGIITCEKTIVLLQITQTIESLEGSHSQTFVPPGNDLIYTFPAVLFFGIIKRKRKAPRKQNKMKVKVPESALSRESS